VQNAQLFSTPPAAPVAVLNPQRIAELEALRQRLGLPDWSAQGAAHWVLSFEQDRLQLRRAGDSSEGPIWAQPAPVGDRPFAGLSRRQPLARALGRKAHRVVDATAGLGEDSFLIASLGLGVVALERSPVVAALLADGLRRARAHPRHATVARRIELVEADARQWLRACRNLPDVVYLDPMFPARRRRSALPVKELRALRELVGDDADAAELLASARAAALQRVVVKRPGYADPLGGRPDLSYKGKLVRYDVYLCHRS
jgi:16S rRNA (guanine1516-N2)-methyltransferase